MKEETVYQWRTSKGAVAHEFTTFALAKKWHQNLPAHLELYAKSLSLFMVNTVTIKTETRLT